MRRTLLLSTLLALPGAFSQSCPAFQTPAQVSNVALPDPFLSVNGTRITQKSQWQCRVTELSQLLQADELGTLPGPPTSLTASFSGNTLTINVSANGESITFKPTITFPSSGTKPYPAIIGVGGISIPTPAGAAVINFDNSGFAQQNDQSSRGQGLFFQLFGTNHSAGAMMAWAWGVSRIIDALQLTPSTNIDLTRLAVSGCSRNGKGALVAGAFEPRILLTIPQESGSGGSACWRLSNAENNNGDTQTASEIVQENVWFSTNFNQFANNVNVLPFDHHSLAAMVAPRALFVIENTAYEWLGPGSSLGCMTAAHNVWTALGLSDGMGFSQIGNHSHCAFPSNQQSDLNAFINKFLFKQSTNTTIFRTDYVGTPAWNPSQWINWNTPTLT